MNALGVYIVTNPRHKYIAVGLSPVAHDVEPVVDVAALGGEHSGVEVHIAGELCQRSVAEGCVVGNGDAVVEPGLRGVEAHDLGG